MRYAGGVVTTLSLFLAGVGIASIVSAAGSDIVLADKMRGHWKSITCELRPRPYHEGQQVEAFNLTRDFRYDGDRFEGTIVAYADPLCETPTLSYSFSGHLISQGASPAASGAEKIDYVLDGTLSLTLKAEVSAAQLNQFPPMTCGEEVWEVDVEQSILETGCPVLNLEAGEIYTDHDIIHVIGDMLFFGAKPVDGSSFDKPENRPVQLQVPLIRVE